MTARRLRRLKKEEERLKEKAMTLGGWISMTLATGATIGLLLWCCWKISTTPDAPDAADDE